MNHIIKLFQNIRVKATVKSPALFLLAGILCVFIVNACDDVIEPDLTNKEVTLVAPADSISTQFSTQTFYWDGVKGALSYHLRIVRPNFTHIEQLVADTAVTETRFTINLNPGKYEWGVSAQNGSSATAYFIRTLQIDSSSNLINQKVQLSYPVQGYTTNSQNVNFSWKQLYNATSYYFELRPSNFNGNPFYTRTTTGDTVNVSNIPEGNFIWAIKASNQNTSTDFSTQTILIDRTAPAKPTLLAPKDRSAVTSWPVKLSWNRNENGAGIYDSIYVAIDTLFTTKVLSQVVDTASLSVTFTQDTTYFWKVKTIDAAGNVSGFDVWKFTKKK